jgi:hypothetical protein
MIVAYFLPSLRSTCIFHKFIFTEVGEGAMDQPTHICRWRETIYLKEDKGHIGCDKKGNVTVIDRGKLRVQPTRMAGKRVL